MPSEPILEGDPNMTTRYQVSKMATYLGCWRASLAEVPADSSVKRVRGRYALVAVATKYKIVK